MSDLATYRRLLARRQRRAVPAAARCHPYLAGEPLVIVGYHLAGEPAAPLALRYGTAPGRWRTVVVPEPRDRTLRFAALATFGADLRDHLTGFSDRDDVPVLDRRGVQTDTEQVCRRAPQLLVPNAATAAWLCDTLGRSLRYLRADGEHPVDPVLPAIGADLSFFATRRVLPGSALVLAAGDLLTTHWVTGQLPAEDANLHTALAWVDPRHGTATGAPVDARPDIEDTAPGSVDARGSAVAGSGGPARSPGVDAVVAALAAEALPPAGPVPDPHFDATRLAPAIERYHADGDPEPLTALLDAALDPAWRATWRVRELVAALPPAAHAEPRWESDRRAWTRHLDRVAAGTAHFSARLDQLRAFRFLGELESRTAALERQMALDDPLVLAGYVASGEALSGQVVARDHERRELNARGSKVLRPLLRIRPHLAFDRPAGTELWLVDRPGVQVRTGVVGADGALDCIVVKGMGRTPQQADAALPAVGADVVLAPFGPQPVFGDTLPEDLPWTHRTTEPDDGPDPGTDPGAGTGAEPGTRPEADSGGEEGRR
ncbi:hypothetical protein AB0I55_21355 [Actinocatenispora sera]|uniref:hypothetical protein n=1 Tax=Actinocatenispora sera TaxID=390989 RepID=UPI0033EAD428